MGNPLGNAFVTTGKDDSMLVVGQLNNLDQPKKWAQTDTDGSKTLHSVIRRILSPVSVQQRIYLPWRQESDDDPKGTMINLRKDDTNTFVVPEILKLAREADMNVKRSLDYDMTKATSIFAPVSNYYFLVFKMDIEAGHEDYNKIMIGEYKKTIATEIRKLERTTHPTFTIEWPIGSGTKVKALMHGPSLLHNIIITKTVDASKGDQWGTKYSVEPEVPNPFSLKVPENIYNTGFPEDMNWDDVFTPEQQKAISDYMKERNAGTMEAALISDLTKNISSPEDIEQAIAKFNPTATDTKGVPMLPKPDLFIAEFNRLAGTKAIGAGTKSQVLVEEAPAVKKESEKTVVVDENTDADDALDEQETPKASPFGTAPVEDKVEVKENPAQAVKENPFAPKNS